MNTHKIQEVASLFFKLGCVAFGGPAAHIAMMEEEVVTKRKWMSRDHFLDLMGATNLIPGPNSTEMAIHCGFHRAGWAGLIVAGTCFIFPAALITGCLAYGYVRFGALPEVIPFLYGIRPAVLAIIAGAIYKLGKKALKNFPLGVIGIVVMSASLFGINEITAILSGGILGMLWLLVFDKKKALPALFAFGGQGTASPLLLKILIPVVPVAISLPKIFFVFLKIGCVLFGSGYVLVAYLQGELVLQRGWLTEQGLLDAIAIGQLTPGPVLTTATFIGYQIQGVMGAVLATAGIFLPSFVFVAILNPLIPRLRKSLWASRFLDAVNISAVGIMAAVTLKLAKISLIDWRTFLIAVLSATAVFVWKKVNVVWIVVLSAVGGYLLSLIP